MAHLLAPQLSALSLAPGAAAASAAQPPPAAPAAGPAHRVAGLEAPLQALRELVAWPVRYAAEGAALGVRWPRGVLLHGPPGCGKSLLVRCVADEAGAALHVLTAADVFGAFVGESERRLREAFAAAAADAAAGRPAIIFLDEARARARAPKRAPRCAQARAALLAAGGARALLRLPV